jgi:hypothetical protein
VLTVEKRLAHLERRALPQRQARLIVVNAGETKSDALARLRISEETLGFELKEGRQIIWIKWAG